jgi:hypothetical protein
LPNGKWKYLLRSALEHDLPPQVAQRKKKTIFDCYAERAMNREKPQLLDLLFSADTWAAAKYTVKLETLKRIVDLPYLDLWNIASLELWLRNSDRYRSLKPFSVKDRPTLHAMPPQEYDRLTSAGLQL